VLFRSHAEPDGTVGVEAWAGPCGVIALPFDAGGHLNTSWLILGAAFGLNARSDAVQARVVFGADF
jgi:hypothetical protein